MLGSQDTPVAPISLDRPGGRAGREGPTSNDGGDGGSSGGGSGGSGGGDNSGSSGGDADDSGFNFGKAVGGVALYGGVIATAWAGHKAFFAKEQPAKKSCCGCSKGKAEAAEPAGKGKKK